MSFDDDRETLSISQTTPGISVSVGSVGTVAVYESEAAMDLVERIQDIPDGFTIGPQLATG
jgi:hypothetical protein